MPINDTFIQQNWNSTAEGETVIQHFLNSKNGERKLFGILERPLSFSNAEEVSYKVCCFGKFGVGKSTLIANLAGISFNNVYFESSGIRVTDIYWPVKIWNKVVLFKLQCWDSGSTRTKKFSHLAQSLKDKADLNVFIFSFNDVSSLNEISNLLSKQNMLNVNNPAILVLGLRYNNNVYEENVKNLNIKNFENKFNLKISSFAISSSMQHNEINYVTPILNKLCETLWLRDQQYILNNEVTV